MNRWRPVVFTVLGVTVLSLLFLLFSVLYTTVGIPSEKAITRQLGVLKQRQQAFLKLEQSLRDWRDVEQTYHGFLEKRLYRFAQFPEFRSQVNSLLNRTNLKVTRFNYQIRQALEGIVRVSMNFVVAGDYRRVKRFLYDIERERNILFVRQLSLSQSESDIQGRIVMEAYFVR